MLLDSQNLFYDNQEINEKTQYSTNTVKFGKGDISYIPLIVQVVEDFKDIEGLEVCVETSISADFNSFNVLISSSLELSELKAGKLFPINNIPQGNLGYIRLKYTTKGDNKETQGKITAGVAAGVDRGIQEI